MDYRLKNLSFIDLDILAKLSDHTSLRALCRSTGFEPPRMSKTLNRIKNELKIELIKTSPHGYILTSEGLYISNQSKEVIKKTEELIPTKKTIQSQIETLTVGSRGFLNLCLTQNLFHALKKNHDQNTHYRFLDLSPDELKKMAFDGLLDIAIHLEPISWPQTWSSVQVSEIKWSFFVNSKHPLSENASIEDLLKYPWLQSTYWNGQRLAHSIDHLNIPLRDRISGHEIQTALNAIEVIKHCDHVAFIPELIAFKYSSTVEIKKINVSQIDNNPRPLYLSVRADKVPAKLFKNLTQILSQELN